MNNGYIITEYVVGYYLYGDNGLPSLTIINNNILKFCGWIIVTNMLISKTQYFSLFVVMQCTLPDLVNIFNSSCWMIGRKKWIVKWKGHKTKHKYTILKYCNAIFCRAWGKTQKISGLLVTKVKIWNLDFQNTK